MSQDLKIEYPNSIKENLIWRNKLIDGLLVDSELASLLYEKCRRDIIFTFNSFFFTFDPRKKNPHIPFLTYPFQEEFIKGIWDDICEGRDAMVEKTRDMGATWMLLGIFFYGWNWHGFQFKVGSRKEELVDRIGDMDSLFERLRYFISYLPNCFLPKDFDSKKHSSYMKLINPEKGNQILGEATTTSFSRQGRYKACLLDEFAFAEGSDAIWQAAGDSTPCRIPVSTPHGKYNKFGQLKTEGKIKIYTLHWSKHPEKTKEWYLEQASRRSKKEIAEELDINYVASAGKPFYHGYHIEAHRRKNLIWNANLPMIRGWDFGYHHPAVVFCQIQDDRLLILREQLGTNCRLRQFRDHIIIFSNENFPQCSEWFDYGDPAGNHESDKDDKTSVEILSEKEIHLISKPSTYQQRKVIIEDKLSTYNENKPMLLVDEKCVIIDEAFQGGYHYPEKILKSNAEMPEKDGWYDHLMNALEYVCVNAFHVMKEDKSYNEHEYNLNNRNISNYGMGARTRR